MRMVHHANASHIGSRLSIADPSAVLYTRVLRMCPPYWIAAVKRCASVFKRSPLW